MDLSMLPHGPEFRFIDRLLDLSPGREARAAFVLKGSEPFLKGHFPGEPLMPGVLMIEAIAQLGGIVAQSDPELPPLPALRLAGVQRAKILGAAAPGDQLTICAELVKRWDDLVQIEGQVGHADDLLVTARVTLGSAGSVREGKAEPRPSPRSRFGFP